jgi:hypothetical protein
MYNGGYQTNFNLGSQVFVPTPQESVTNNTLKLNFQEFVPTVPKSTAMF